MTTIAALTFVPCSRNDPAGRSIHTEAIGKSLSRCRGPFATTATSRPPLLNFDTTCPTWRMPTRGQPSEERRPPERIAPAARQSTPVHCYASPPRSPPRATPPLRTATVSQRASYCEWGHVRRVAVVGVTPIVPNYRSLT